MKSRLIFYLSQKTSYCELALLRALKGKGIELEGTFYAASPDSLGKKLIEGFNCVNLIFIIGGIGRREIRSLQNVLSKALANVSKSFSVQKLKNPTGNPGYIISCGRQTIVSLPDEPEQIEGVLDENLLSFLAKLYGAKEA